MTAGVAPAAPQGPALLPPAEAAELLGITVDALRKRADRGAPSAVRRTPGGTRRYREDEVRALAELGPLMSRTEVAAVFGVDPDTVSRWGSTGVLKGVAVSGKCLQYRESDVRAFLDRGERT